MWESSINIYHTISDMVTEEIDGNIIVEVKKQLGVDINKDELIKAINYDRNQYEKGYQDGLNADKWIPVSESGYPKPEDEYKRFLTIDNKGEITIQKFLLSLDEDPQPYFTGWRNIVAYMPLPEPYKAESEDE